MLAEEVARRAQRVWPAADAGGGVITLRDAGTAVRGGARWSDQEARAFRAAEFAARPERFLDGGLDWLDAVIFGPWIHLTAAAFRARVPARYPIRLYPDITHCWSCQYPVPDWDPALAACQGREPINPRPADQAHIFALTAPHSIGALTYCEGTAPRSCSHRRSFSGYSPDSAPPGRSQGIVSRRCNRREHHHSPLQTTRQLRCRSANQGHRQSK